MFLVLRYGLSNMLQFFETPGSATTARKASFTLISFAKPSVRRQSSNGNSTTFSEFESLSDQSRVESLTAFARISQTF